MRRMAFANVEFFAANGDVRTNTSATDAFQLYEFARGPVLPAAPAPSRTGSPSPPKPGHAGGSMGLGDKSASPSSPGTLKRNQLLLESGE